MSTKRQKLISAAVCILGTQAALMTINSASAQTPKKGEKPVNCFGVNSCKGTNSCVVTKNNLDKVNAVFKNTYTKNLPHECAGMSECNTKKGYLAWVSKPSTKECFEAGGFVFEKNEVVIRDKDGIKG